jgi:hypothetical protein
MLLMKADIKLKLQATTLAPEAVFPPAKARIAWAAESSHPVFSRRPTIVKSGAQEDRQ